MIQRHYDWLKSLAQIWIPAVATLYFTLSQIWGIPYGAEIVGSLTAVDTFLGVILRISTSKYTPPTDGQLLVDQTRNEANRYQLDISTPLDQIPDKDHILLKVTPGAF